MGWLWFYTAYLGAKQHFLKDLHKEITPPPKVGLIGSRQGFEARRVLGTVMGETSPKHNCDSFFRNPTFYLIGT